MQRKVHLRQIIDCYYWDLLRMVFCLISMSDKSEFFEMFVHHARELWSPDVTWLPLTACDCPVDGTTAAAWKHMLLLSSSLSLFVNAWKYEVHSYVHHCCIYCCSLYQKFYDWLFPLIWTKQQKTNCPVGGTTAAAWSKHICTVLINLSLSVSLKLGTGIEWLFTTIYFEASESLTAATSLWRPCWWYNSSSLKHICTVLISILPVTASLAVQHQKLI